MTSTRLRISRPVFGCTAISLAASAYMLLLTNFTFWEKGLKYFAGNEVQFAALVVLVFALLSATLLGFSAKYLIKPFVITLILICATASYFVDSFGILITQNTLRDVVETTPNEARQFFTWSLFFHLGVFGGLPSIVLIWIRVNHQPIAAKLAYNTVFIVACIALAGGLIAANFRPFSAVNREHKDLLASLNPAAPIFATLEFFLNTIPESGLPLKPIGSDAKLGSRISAIQKPVLTIFVVGESARSQNFSLNGYARETNPALAREKVFSFSNFQSCSTSTRISLQCIFSPYGRADFSLQKSAASENLLDIFQRAGMTVSWWDNNTGSYKLADRVGYELLSREIAPQHCPNGECTDGIFLERLRQYLGSITKNTVLVMHQIGSHGPGYFLRYPPEFERFTPACRSTQLTDCTVTEIVNAYDNSIAYTDEILAQIIAMAKEQEGKLATALFYTSDHGESLGEFGLYLHNMAYFLAPETQTKVPFIAWFSTDFAKSMRLDLACIAALQKNKLSHDILFHTLLGIMDVEAQVYRQKLDAFAPCRR
ncbi:MAG: phosphoethanolamine transferase [Alphaproteobacteria bacterium]